jgi:hypothetical protein
MPRAQLTYRCPAPNLRSQHDAVAISSPNARFTKLSVESHHGPQPEDRYVEIAAEIDPVFDLDEAKAIADPVVAGFLDQIALELDCGIEAVEPSGTLHDPGSGQRTTALTYSASAVITAVSPVASGATVQTNVKRRVESPAPPWPRLATMYRHALSSGNATEKYLALYQILLDRWGDKVGAVDRWLASQGDPQQPGPRGTETAYTKARGDINHARGADLAQARQDMLRLLPGLMRRVKQAIATP